MTNRSQVRDKTRQEAWELLAKHTRNKNLRKHGLAVEAAMRHYAKLFSSFAKASEDKGENEEKWGIVGLLHDFDYEKYPSLDDHPFKGQEILKEAGYSEEIRRAIMAHAPHTGITRDSLLEKTIYAVDELTGFLVAVALVRPSKKLAEVDVKAVRKKMKQPSFAAGVKREDIVEGAKELGIDLDEHIQNVLTAMQEIADELGL